MSRLRIRVSRLEAACEERLDAACKRLVRLLTDEELEALAVMGDGDLTPEAEAAFDRMLELATPEERLVLAAEEPWYG